VSRLGDARKAVARGDADEALVALWNELEPARLAGDRRRLEAVADLAGRIAADGDEAHRREAERLLEAAQALDADGELVAATAQLDAEVGAAGGGPVEAPGRVGGPADEEEGSRGIGLGNLLWALLILAVVLANVLRGLAD
jgi:hypothetical protein